MNTGRSLGRHARPGEIQPPSPSGPGADLPSRGGADNPDGPGGETAPETLELAGTSLALRLAEAPLTTRKLTAPGDQESQPGTGTETSRPGKPHNFSAEVVLEWRSQLHRSPRQLIGQLQAQFDLLELAGEIGEARQAAAALTLAAWRSRAAWSGQGLNELGTAAASLLRCCDREAAEKRPGAQDAAAGEGAAAAEQGGQALIRALVRSWLPATGPLEAAEQEQHFLMLLPREISAVASPQEMAYLSARWLEARTPALLLAAALLSGVAGWDWRMLGARLLHGAGGALRAGSPAIIAAALLPGPELLARWPALIARLAEIARSASRAQEPGGAWGSAAQRPSFSHDPTWVNAEDFSQAGAGILERASWRRPGEEALDLALACQVVRAGAEQLCALAEEDQAGAAAPLDQRELRERLLCGCLRRLGQHAAARELGHAAPMRPEDLRGTQQLATQQLATQQLGLARRLLGSDLGPEGAAMVRQLASKAGGSAGSGQEASRQTSQRQDSQHQASQRLKIERIWGMVIEPGSELRAWELTSGMGELLLRREALGKPGAGRRMQEAACLLGGASGAIAEQLIKEVSLALSCAQGAEDIHFE